MANQHERLKELFLAALEQPASGRDAWIERQCGADSSLRRELCELLSAHDQAADFMEDATVATPSKPDVTSVSFESRMPEEIGHRKIISKLGEGGFGEVYLAEQHEPVRRQVAIKVVRRGMGSREVVARFESERQALALMSHPGIAQVFDAGTTSDGLPFFVMEYVPGERITDYCRNNALSVRARVRLMEQVCLAVEHAHQKGVIHRDIKPSNVLVAQIDGLPAPKVIDFGIAKAVDRSAGVVTDVTGTAQVVGTPQYMSPEQASFGEIDVDTRTDVYGLGALLYEILTDEPVFESDRLKGVGPAELERIIREETPIRPSRRVALTAVRSQRSRQLRGELDWIIGRALEKDRSRRYPTANALASDLRRHLEGEPVWAGPPSGAYRIRKFLARHRAETAGGLALLIMLVTLVIVSQTTAAREERARQRAERELAKFEQVAAFTEDMISGIDPRTARGKDTALLEHMLEDAATRLDDSPPGDAEVEARLRTMIGRAQSSVANWEEAARQLEAAFALARSTDDIDEELTLEIQSSLAELLAQIGKLDEAYRMFDEVSRKRRQRFGPDDERTLEAVSNAGVLLGRMDLYDEALGKFREVHERRQRTLGEQHEDTIAALNGVAVQTGNIGDTEESIRLLRIVLDHQVNHLGEDDATTLMTKNNLASALQDDGRLDEAVIMLREVMAAKERIFEPHHPSMLIAMNNLASALGSSGHHDEAIALLTNAVTISAGKTGNQNTYTLTLQHNLASNLTRAGRYEEALAYQSRIVETFGELVGLEHPRTIGTRNQLANIYRKLGRIDEAIAESSRCIRAAEKVFPEGHRMRAITRDAHGMALAAADRHRDAVEHLLTAYATYAEAIGEDAVPTRTCANSLAYSYRLLGDTEAADRWDARGKPAADE